MDPEKKEEWLQKRKQKYFRSKSKNVDLYALKHHDLKRK